MRLTQSMPKVPTILVESQEGDRLYFSTTIALDSGLFAIARVPSSAPGKSL